MIIRKTRARAEVRRIDPTLEGDPLRWIVVAVLVATAIAMATATSI